MMTFSGLKMWRKTNLNPCGKSIGDCAVRAVAVALKISWMDAYSLLTAEGRRQCDMPSADAVWGAVLREHGFRRYAIPNSCPNCYTAADFAADHPDGVFTLAFGGHVATIRDGWLMDSWDSTNEVPIYYYGR